ncbi:MAG: hypothetical protein AB8E15_02480 [Bdellovibrionales bacterium]
MKLVFLMISTLLVYSTVNASEVDYSCKSVDKNGARVKACFPFGHKCMDLHGIGDGNPIQIDCFSSGTRTCYPDLDNWPKCAGGILANECKEIEINGELKSVCFPVGKTCKAKGGFDIGTWKQIDCFESGTMSCYKGDENWPECIGGKIL